MGLGVNHPIAWITHMKPFRIVVITLVLALAGLSQTFDDFDYPSVVLLPDPKMQFLDNNGNPVAGGKVYTYLAGTTTPLATYTSSAGTTANANPVVLDSAGRGSIWIKGESYKVVLCTPLGGAIAKTGCAPSGTVIWTVDNVTDTTFFYLEHLRAITDSALLGYSPSIGGAVPDAAYQRSVQARLSDNISVMDFGAVGDGTSHPVSGWCSNYSGTRYTATTDAACLTAIQADYPDVAAITEERDTVAINAAIDAAVSASVPEVHIPHGTYVITGLTIASPVTVTCSSPSVSTLLLATNSASVITVDGTSNVTIQGCKFDGDYPDITGGYGVLVADSSFVTVQNNLFTNQGTTGVSLQDSTDTFVRLNRFETIQKSGVRIEEADGSGSHRIFVEDNYFKDVVVDGTGGHAAFLVANGSGTTPEHDYIYARRNYIQNSGAVGIGYNGADYSEITGNRIIGNGTNGECIAFDGAYLLVDGNTVNGCGSYGIMYYGVSYHENGHVRISDNISWDNASQGVSLVWGQGSVTFDDVWIANNRAYDTATAPAQNYGIQFFGADGVTPEHPSNIIVVGNDFATNATGGFNYWTEGAYVTQWNNLNSTAVSTTAILAGTIPWTGANGMLDGSAQYLYIDPTSHKVSVGLAGTPPSPTEDLTVVGEISVTKASPSTYPMTVKATGTGSQPVGVRMISNSDEVARIGQPAGTVALAVSNLNTTAHSQIEFFTEGEAAGNLRGYIEDRGWVPPQVAFANLSTASVSFMVYCTNCNIVTASPYACTSGGTGAWAFNTNGNWKCPF
jgi:nitrous oxidase accessory protein NosD